MNVEDVERVCEGFHNVHAEKHMYKVNSILCDYAHGF